MPHPFQCLAIACQNTALNENNAHFLLAACGSSLISSSLTSGDILSSWSSAPGVQRPLQGDQQDNEPPNKRQKSTPEVTAPNIIKLVVSPDGNHAAAVTDDKHIRVFEITSTGELHQLSLRCMPKRPCAIQILPDKSTILCGDKFGDVYSLPLIPVDHVPNNNVNGITDGRPVAKPVQQFRPSARTSTVHTQANRRTLEAQQKQQNLNAKTKEPLAFEHKLLLGHVSMLTDMLYAVADGENDRKRGYIFTADRDEHIRLSRGPPQSHIIENYCLGHTDFVSKICAVPGSSKLISGGGDDWLGVWDWPSCTLLQRIGSISSWMGEVKTVKNVENTSRDRPVVSGIWVTGTPTGAVLRKIVAVTCERRSELVLLPASELYHKMTPREQGDIRELNVTITKFAAPILDIVTINHTLIISFDERDNSSERVQAFDIMTEDRVGARGLTVLPFTELTAKLKQLNKIQTEINNDRALDGLLYSIANLRKWAGSGDGDDGGEDKE